MININAFVSICKMKLLPTGGCSNTVNVIKGYLYILGIWLLVIIMAKTCRHVTIIIIIKNEKMIRMALKGNLVNFL